MRTVNFAIAGFVLFSLLLSIEAKAIKPPKLRRYVTDQTKTLTKREASALNDTLAAYDKRTSNQFVVLIIRTLKGESLEEFSLAVAERNKIGRKGRDNGLLLLIALEDRKLRFEVGYGLEGTLTDAKTSTIIQNVIAPEFRAGNVAEGVRAGMYAAMQAAERFDPVVVEQTEPVYVEKTPEPSRKEPSDIVAIIFLSPFIIGMILSIVHVLRRQKPGFVVFKRSAAPRPSETYVSRREEAPARESIQWNRPRSEKKETHRPSSFSRSSSSGGSSSSSRSTPSRSSSSSGSSSRGFSGGGGSFGGGGASGSW